MSSRLLSFFRFSFLSILPTSFLLADTPSSSRTTPTCDYCGKFGSDIAVVPAFPSFASTRNNIGPLLGRISAIMSRQANMGRNTITHNERIDRFANELVGLCPSCGRGVGRDADSEDYGYRSTVRDATSFTRPNPRLGCLDCHNRLVAASRACRADKEREGVRANI